MASIKERVRRDGATVWDVKWRIPQLGVDAQEWKRESKVCGTLEAAVSLRDEKAETVERRGRKAVRHGPLASLDLYISSKRASADGISDMTERCIRQHVGTFLAYMGSKPLDVWTSRDFDAFLLTKREAWSKNTVRKFASTLRAFLRGLAKMKPPVACRDITDGFKFPKRVRFDGPHWTWDEVLRICAASLEMEAEGRLSLVAPVHVCAYGGIDEPDFAVFAWKHIDTSSDPWVISLPRHKTNVPRRIKVHPKLRAVLEPRRGTPEALVCDMPKHYSSGYRALLRLLKRASIAHDRRAGGWKRMRRSYGTELGKRHTDFPTLRECLGHARDSAETQKYLCTDEDRKAAAILTLA